MTEEKKDKSESDNKCVGLLILNDTLYTHMHTHYHKELDRNLEDNNCSY